MNLTFSRSTCTSCLEIFAHSGLSTWKGNSSPNILFDFLWPSSNGFFVCAKIKQVLESILSNLIFTREYILYPFLLLSFAIVYFFQMLQTLKLNCENRESSKIKVCNGWIGWILPNFIFTWFRFSLLKLSIWNEQKIMLNGLAQ